VPFLSWQELQLTAGTEWPSSLSFDANNRILSGNGYSDDAAGNVSSLNDGAGHICNYTYDAENRLTGISGAASASYVYDAEGRRVQKTTGSTTLNFAYDLAGHDILEYQGSVGNRMEVYLPGSGTI
jgi:YD repeat-containing protein